MNKRPGQVSVTTEVAFCSFCGRPRTLRREERHLGTLVRTTVTCETCHRTLSSTIGVAGSEPAPAESAPAAEAVEQPAQKATARRTTKAPAAVKPVPSTKPKPKAAPARRTTKSK